MCLAAFAGAAIAKANAMKTGFEAVKLGLIAFIVPFFFVFEPALLLNGEPSVILQAIVSATVGLIALAAGLQGYLLRTCPLWQRILLAASGIMLILPGSLSDVAGFGVFVAVLLLQLILNRGLNGARVARREKA